jgi:tetratricopeptide (TPR) repeat protein
LPVHIQCISVVIRNEALDQHLDGGAENFRSIAPNSMSFSDDRLSQASFMSPVDAEEYAKDLELRGLTRQGESPDFVIVQSHDQSVEPPCQWLVLFEYEQRLIATIRGSDSRKIIAAASHAEFDPEAVKHYSSQEIAEKFEFVRRDDNIDTYREKSTGKLVYHARRTKSRDEVFSEAFKVVWSHRRGPGDPVKLGEEADAIRDAIENLQSLAAKYPATPKVFLGLGMAWFAIGEPEKARRQLKRAVELEPENTAQLKELAGVCLAGNDLASALEAATKAVAIEPDDIELLGNLSVIQLISGDVAAAEKTIAHAVRLKRGDTINLGVQAIIASVAAGKRDCPTTLEEMMRRPKLSRKPKSWLARLLGF